MNKNMYSCIVDGCGYVYSNMICIMQESKTL